MTRSREPTARAGWAHEGRVVPGEGGLQSTLGLRALLGASLSLEPWKPSSSFKGSP